jgi:hypothetical protein
MNCCACKDNPKVPGFQVCAECLAKFKKHIAAPHPTPFLEPPKPEPTPNIRGRNNEGGHGVELPKEQAAGAPLPKSAHA